MAVPRSPGLHGNIAFDSNHLNLPLGSPRSPMGDFVAPRSPTFPDQQSPRANDGPLPLPSFVFPARASPASAPASFSRATGRRPASAIELKASPKRWTLRKVTAHTRHQNFLPSSLAPKIKVHLHRRETSKDDPGLIGGVQVSLLEVMECLEKEWA
jgi:hypothetical protein